MAEKKEAEFDLCLRVRVKADDIMVDKEAMIKIMSQLLGWPNTLDIGGVEHEFVYVDVIDAPLD